MSDKKEVYALFHHDTPKNGSDYGYLRLTFVYLGDNGKPRNFGDYSYEIEDQGHDLRDLTIEANYTSTDEPIHVWGSEYRYLNVYSIDVRRADSMAKTLKKIAKGLDKLNEQYGYASDFATSAIRIMRVLGVKAILKESDKSRGGWSYDDSEYITLPVADFKYTVNSALSKAAEVYHHEYTPV